MTPADQKKGIPVTVVGASAGTGKTHRLATDFTTAVLGSERLASTPPGKILATTFTNKAADELTERVRRSLIEQQQWESAQLVRSGYVGTVNSVCGRLVSQFALEAGVSPVSDVLPAERVPGIFRIAAEGAIDSFSDRLDAVAQRLSVPDWRKVISDVVSLSRANGIMPDALKDCGEASWKSLSRLLPKPESADKEVTLDQDLENAIAKALPQLLKFGDATKATAGVIDILKTKQSILRSGRLLGWNEWAQLTKLKPGKDSFSFVEPVIEAAAAHPRHPRLHSDLQTMITGVFECASLAITEYEQFKKAQGFVDFTDQEYLALRLLERGDVQQTIAERLELCLVDEFQDTSPIQLAIFLQLAHLVKQSVWVGDEKQAIYGFRGTDPALIDAVVRQLLPSSGGTREQLDTSYRARPGLVNFVNDLFAPAFGAMGFRKEHVRIERCARSDTAGHNHPLHLWWVQGDNWDDATSALCAQVSNMLSNPETFRVGIPKTKETRPLRGSDIAILCRTNPRCDTVANGLSLAGLRVSTERTGLLETDECALAFAALRYLVDPNDSLAAAEIIHFSSAEPERDSWLSEWMNGDFQEMRSRNKFLLDLDASRDRLIHLTPDETLDLALSAGGVIDTVRRWPGARQKLSNLTALRGLALEYEELCLSRRSAATPAGFVVFLFKELEEGGKQAPNPDEQAVHVLTYHGAKGLEWPVVILVDLHTPKEASPFGLCVESRASELDSRNPLKDRWLRYWPWPYGDQAKNVGLDGTASGCDEMIAAKSRTDSENLRLLYVGATRARDYLILACRQFRRNTGWLDLLKDKSGNSILALPAEAGSNTISIGGNKHRIEVSELPVPPEEPQARTTGAATSGGALATHKAGMIYQAIRPQAPGEAHPPFRLSPSSLHVEGDIVDVAEDAPAVTSIGGRLPITGNPDMAVLGEVVHRFLAADCGNGSSVERESRLSLAKSLLARWGVCEITPESLVEASDRLAGYLAETYPGCKLRAEVPINGRSGLQRVHGRIDLVVETADGFVVVDHKTYPGRYEKWVSTAVSHRPQLALYGDLVAFATGRPVRHLLIHMPVVGKIVDVT